MLSKKIILAGIGTLGLLGVTTTVCPAQSVYSPGNINSILEDNSLRDATTRYVSVYSFFFPEEASRLGFTSDRMALNDRTPETDAQALQAIEAVRNSLNEISKERLSPSKIPDYDLLKNALDNTIWILNQNRLARDPLYYTQGLDAVYDLLLFDQPDKRQEHRDFLGRVSALPKLAQQARQNLTDTSPQAARLAMEKAYYAYLSFDEIAKRLSAGANLTVDYSSENTDKVIHDAKAAIKSMFDWFKALSQQEDMLLDFRLGKKPYYTWLNVHYHISDKPEVLEKKINRHFEDAQKDLWLALRPFELSADMEEVTMVEDLNELPQNASYVASGKNKADSKASKQPKPVYTPPMANQFYALAGQLQSPFTLNNLLDDLTKQASAFGARLVRAKVIPATMSFSATPMPAYFAYQNLYLQIPALRTLFVRLPSGNQLAKEQALRQDFNEPSYKMLISRELVPGHYYQEYSTTNFVRRTLGSPTLDNGWKDYALHIAESQGYFLTDEEQLFLAWHRYYRAVSALVDQRLHTHQYTYDSATRFLVDEQGFTEEQAARLINEVIAAPGQSLSYVAGELLWKQYADYYRKKFKDDGQTNALLLQAGNVLPSDLKAELKRLYRK